MEFNALVNKVWHILFSMFYISTFVRILINQCEMNCWYVRTDTTDVAQFLLVSAKRSRIPKKATSYPYLCKSFSAEQKFGRVHTLDILLMNKIFGEATVICCLTTGSASLRNLNFWCLFFFLEHSFWCRVLAQDKKHTKYIKKRLNQRIKRSSGFLWKDNKPVSKIYFLFLWNTRLIIPHNRLLRRIRFSINDRL